jgi:hypothetical protein
MTRRLGAGILSCERESQMEGRSDMRAMSRGAVRVGLLGAASGLIAGLMLAGTQMIYGWASSAHSAWDAPMAIWAWIAGLEHFGQPGNHIGPILLGLGGHLVNSIVAGLIFVGLLAAFRVRNDALTFLGAVAYGLVLFAVMRYGILPLRDSTKALFTTSLVSPQWVWWLAHGIFGITLGAVYVAARAGGRPLARVTPMRGEETRRAAA